MIEFNSSVEEHFRQSILILDGSQEAFEAIKGDLEGQAKELAGNLHTLLNRAVK